MNPIFERNLGELMRRAYVPARPSDEFCEALRARVLATLDETARTNPARRTHADARPRTQPISLRQVPLRQLSLAAAQGLAAAAAVLLLVAGWRALGIGSAESPARESLAVTTTKGGSGSDVLWRGAPLEVSTESGESLAVLALTGDRFVLAGESRARFGAERQVELRAGEVRVQKGAYSPELEIATPGGPIAWHSGEVTLRAEGGRTQVHAAGGGGLAAGVPLDGDAVGVLAGGAWHSAKMALTRAEAAPPRVALQGTDPGTGTPDGTNRGTVRADGSETGPSPGQVPRPSAGRGAVRGRVVEEASGEPVPAFRVWVREEIELPQVTEPVCYTVENADGEFAVENLAAGSYSVLVESEGRAAWRTTGVAVGGDPAWLDVTQGAGGAVRGYVLDAESRTPIAGALVLAQLDLPQQIVEMQGFVRNPMPLAHARTDASGAFLLEPLSVGPHKIRVSDLEHAPTWVELVPVVEDEVQDVGEITLASGGVVFGRVEQEDGQPFAGAEVIASRIDMQGPNPVLDFGRGVAAADGTYRIDGLPAGIYVVLSISEQPSGLPEWSRLQQTTVTRERESRVDFLSAVRTRTLTGRLVDASGDPVGGWFLTMAAGWDPDGFTDWLATRSGDDGRFRFVDVKPGPHQLYMGAETNQVLMRVDLLEMPDVGDLDLEIQLPDTSIHGRVVDATTGDVVRGEIVIEHYDTERSAWVFAGRGYRAGEQEFHFDYLQPGTYRVTAAEVEGLADRTSEPFTLRAGTPVELELPLNPAGRLTVEVTDPDGRPVAGARVDLLRGGEDLREHRTPLLTNLEGSANVDHLALVGLEVIVDAPGYAARTQSAIPTIEGTLVRVALLREDR